MQELKKDYQAGKISEDKYRYLSKEYSNRLATIDATNRVRNMQGRQKGTKPPSSVQRSMAEASRKEDMNLVNKYVVKPKEDQKIKKAPEVSNKGKYAILAVICLIGAFLVGISFGLFNGPQTPISAVNAMIDDTAFPEVISNVTNVTVDNVGDQTTSNNNLTTDNNGSDNNGGGSNNSNGDSSNTDKGPGGPTGPTNPSNPTNPTNPTSSGV